MNTTNQIFGYGVYYVPNRNGKLFAGLKCELQIAFKSEKDAIKVCDSMNMGEYLDELHVGYRVYPMNWIPKGVILK
jgi:hypothetical protein